MKEDFYSMTAINLDPFFFKKKKKKKINIEIKLCQGCKGSLQVDGKITLLPYDFGVTRDNNK